MARIVHPPALPTTPGGWMACYRYRLKRRDGSPSSPEHLAHDLAVSGDTVRRWESGTAKPSKADLLRFSELCGLSSIESAFLLEAFAAVDAEAAPDSVLFRKYAGTLLSAEFPAYIYDSLFHVRAWNSYMDLVHTHPFNTEGEHSVERVFQVPDPRLPVSNTLRTREMRADWWLRAFWFQTARLCGLPAYVSVVRRLGENEDFAEHWQALGLSNYSESHAPIGAPTSRVEVGKGTFRTSTSPLNMPPTYFLREFVPVDDQSWEQLNRRRAMSKPEVGFATLSHWSENAPRLKESPLLPQGEGARREVTLTNSSQFPRRNPHVRELTCR